MTRILLTALLALASFGAAALADDAPKVLVAPFTEISDGAKRDWVGRAIEQSLVAELSRLSITPMSAKPDLGLIDDVEDATKAARATGAQYVVFGSYQLVEEELRVTGQVIEAASGAVLGGIKATGNLRDLFGIEDIVAAQVKRALAGKLAPTTQPTDQLAERTTVEPSGPVRAEPSDRRQYEGSELEQSLASNRPIASAPPPYVFEDERERYRYSAPTYTPYAPYGWSPYGYGYGPRSSYTPRYYYGGYDCGPRVIVIPRTQTRTQLRVSVPRPVYREPTVPNGNYNRGQGNTMQGGPGNTMTGRGQSGNTITGGSGNANRSGSR